VARSCASSRRRASRPPYAIPVRLRRLPDLRGTLRDWSVIQRDVADRLLAAPGSRAYSSLTVLHRPRRWRACGAGSACSIPCRTCAHFVRITPRSDAPLGADELGHVEVVVRGAFDNGARRRERAARRAGDPGAACAAAGIDPRARAESLAPEAFLALARAFGASRAGLPAPEVHET
jgi:16S rRNA (adenine1518-N6/adenine1519-N6)-dimethyltransferase